jgi:sec-independent protein translocase protein TatA
MDLPGPVELLIIAGVIIVLFGSRKLPEAARSMGRSLRIFKSEVRGMEKDDAETPAVEAPVLVPAAAPIASPVPVPAHPSSPPAA